MTKKHTFFLALLLLVNLCFSQIPENITFMDSVANAIGDIKEELIPIKEHLYVIQPYGMAGNMGLFITDDGVILIDDQYKILADRIKEIIANVTDKKIKMIINTHYHFDHTHGNLAFGKEDIPIISQQNAFERMCERQVIPTFFNVVQKAYPQFARPTMTFVEKFVFREKGETIELIHLKNAHTDGDLIVHFVQANTYYTGDIFITSGLPHIDEKAGGDIYGVMAAVDYLLQNSDGDTQFIPGHGTVSFRKDVMAYRDLLTTLLSIVEESAKNGKDIVEIIRKVKEHMDYDSLTMTGDIFIRQVYRSAIKRLEE